MRKENNITQQELAKKIGSSQSRVSKIECGDPSVTIDLMLIAILAMKESIINLIKEFYKTV